VQVRAVDGDAGHNGEIEYSFSGQTQAQHGAQFGVRNSTGVVYVHGVVDYEQTKVLSVSLCIFFWKYRLTGSLQPKFTAPYGRVMRFTSALGLILSSLSCFVLSDFFVE